MEKNWTLIRWRQTWKHLVTNDHLFSRFIVLCLRTLRPVFLIFSVVHYFNRPHEGKSAMIRVLSIQWKALASIVRIKLSGKWPGCSQNIAIKCERKVSMQIPSYRSIQHLWAIRPKRKSPRRPGWNRGAAAQGTSSAVAEVPCTSYMLSEQLVLSFFTRASVFSLPH